MRTEWDARKGDAEQVPAPSGKRLKDWETQWEQEASSGSGAWLNEVARQFRQSASVPLRVFKACAEKTLLLLDSKIKRDVALVGHDEEVTASSVFALGEFTLEHVAAPRRGKRLDSKARQLVHDMHWILKAQPTRQHIFGFGIHYPPGDQSAPPVLDVWCLTHDTLLFCRTAAIFKSRNVSQLGALLNFLVTATWSDIGFLPCFKLTGRDMVLQHPTKTDCFWILSELIFPPPIAPMSRATRAWATPEGFVPKMTWRHAGERGPVNSTMLSREGEVHTAACNATVAYQSATSTSLFSVPEILAEFSVPSSTNEEREPYVFVLGERGKRIGHDSFPDELSLVQFIIGYLRGWSSPHMAYEILPRHSTIVLRPGGGYPEGYLYE